MGICKLYHKLRQYATDKPEWSRVLRLHSGSYQNIVLLLEYPDVLHPELVGQGCGDASHRLLIESAADGEIYEQVEGAVEGRGVLNARGFGRPGALI